MSNRTTRDALLEAIQAYAEAWKTGIDVGSFCSPTKVAISLAIDKHEEFIQNREFMATVTTVIEKQLELIISRKATANHEPLETPNPGDLERLRTTILTRHGRTGP